LVLELGEFGVGVFIRYIFSLWGVHMLDCLMGKKEEIISEARKRDIYTFLRQWEKLEEYSNFKKHLYISE
jgi:hypothetical protein